MPFKIVQTIEGGEICLSVVPSGWEANGVLWWPKKHLVGKLSQIETSIPNEKWEKMNCIRKREFSSRKEADDELDRMETKNDTDVENYPLPPPKKRLRQESSSKVYVAKNFNELVDNISVHTRASEEREVERAPVPNPDIEANIMNPVDDQQVLYVTESIDSGVPAVQGEPSQVLYMSNGVDINNLDTVLENQRIIMDNQGKLMMALAKIQTRQEYAITHCICRTSRNDTAPVKSNAQDVFSPVDSLIELSALEKSLEDDKLMQKYLSGMSFICGATGKSQGMDCCYKLIDYFFTRKFLTQCSWTGMVRLGGSQPEPSTSSDPGPKVPLKFYKSTRALFLNLIMQADKDFSEVDCEKFFKVVLKNSKQRLSAKALTSKHKNRPSNMKYNKPEVASGTVMDSVLEESNDISTANITVM
ncbi:uncharacterized protein LOC134204204 [Armigeres subalbatus]|uniref:uncharacterized protein LOC134204204 n=1 Tax=Armigeres subalbatus TaxID=124917 RepID=UPI002ED5854C